MITIDRGTKYKLLIVTNPNCGVCREMQKSSKCNNIPLTRKLVLAPFSQTDELSLQVIFKTHNPLDAYKKLLNGKQINESEIDWSKDITYIWNENITMFDYLTTNYDLKGTPAFFIIDENNRIIEQIKLEMEPADVLMFNIKKYDLY